MSFVFADGFDLYTAAADMTNGYWDNGSVTGSFAAGRFTGSRAIELNGNQSIVKTSAVNDAVHHLVMSVFMLNVTGNTSTAQYVTLLDGSTAQCTVAFCNDGAIRLQSGAAGGTVLATFAGAVPVTSTWYAFECEIVINNTTGSWTVRKNGNTTADFTATGLNTRPTSSNNYANKVQFGLAGTAANNVNVDDFFWQSGSSTGTWLGDIRCYTRMPASDASVQFSRSPTTFFAQNNSGTTTTALTANVIRCIPVVAPTTGTLTSLQHNFNAGITGHAKMALYDNTGAAGNPGVLLATSIELTNPGAGVNVFTVTGGPVVTRGTTYHIALWSDVSITGTGASASGVVTLALTYTTSFPSPLGVAGSGVASGVGSSGMNVTPSGNAMLVNEAQQDATATYVYDSTVNDADFYNIASISGSIPSTVYAVTTRAYMQKSDVGSRTAAVQLKSGTATLLCHFDGTNGSTSFTDDAGHTLTATGATVTTTSPKFGTGCADFSGSSSARISVGGSASDFNFGAGQFTVEAWGYFTSPPGSSTLIILSQFGFSSNLGWDFGMVGGSLAFYYSTTGTDNPNVGAAFTPTLNTWYHLAADRDASNVLRVYVNGSVIASATVSSTIFASTQACLIGNDNNNNRNFLGHLDEARITKGLAQYGGVFTPQSTAFSNSTTVASPTLTLTTSGWQWAWRTDITDPNTGSAWTASDVNQLQIGPLVVS